MKKFLLCALILFVLGLSGLAAQTRSSQRSDVRVGIISFGQNVRNLTGDDLILLNQGGDAYEKLVNIIENEYGRVRAGEVEEMGTTLYYAIHSALATITNNAASLPTNTETINLLVFTDGLDNNSFSPGLARLRGESEYFAGRRLSEYQRFIYNELSNREIPIKSTPPKKLNINTYSIGVQGSDVTDKNAFQTSIKSLVSNDGYWGIFTDFESKSDVTDKSGVTRKQSLYDTFRLIASTLNRTSKIVTFNIATPAYPVGTKVLMTFDKPNNDRNTDNDAKTSNVFLEGEVMDYSNERYQFKIADQRNVSTSSGKTGDTVYGTFDKMVNYTFNNFTGFNSDNPRWTDNFIVWYKYEGSNMWQKDSELNIAQAARTETEFSSTVLYLVLDSSYSMKGNLDSIRGAGKVLIDILNTGEVIDDTPPPPLSGGPIVPLPADPPPVPAADWKNNWLYLGARLGGGPNMYKLGEDWQQFPNDITGAFSFNAAAHFSLQLASVFAMQLEFMYAHDAGEMSGSNIWSYNDDIKINFSYDTLLIPILAKFTFRPGNFLIAPFGGVYLSLPLGKLAFEESTTLLSNPTNDYKKAVEFKPPLLGFMVGANFGVKLGPGVLFADVRYAGDFGDTTLDFGGSAPEKAFTRGKIPITLGYEIGVIQKRK